MAKSHTFYLTDHHIDLKEVELDEIRTVFTRTYDSVDWQEELSVFLDQNQFEKISVFIDVMGEEIKHESIPHINGKDRELLLDRKLKSAFPSADFTWKRHQGRNKDGRKDDSYLLLGVTLPSSVSTTLDILRNAKKRVYGIYLLSALQQQLSAILPSRSQYLIVSGVTENNKSKRTFRQTYYKNDVLSLSRLNSLVGKSEEDIYLQLLAEIERTYQFLASSRQIDQGLVLNVIIILDKKGSAGLIAHNVNSNLDLKFAGLDDLSEKMGIKASLNYKTLPDLLISFATKKSLKPHFQPKDLCHEYNIVLRKRTLNLSSVIMVIITVLMSVVLWKQGSDELEHSEFINSSLSNIEAQRNLLSSSIPETEIPPKIMSQAVRVYKSIDSGGRKPGLIFDVLARAYSGYQDVEITKILWVGDSNTLDDMNDDESSGGGELSFIERMDAKGKIKIIVRPDKTLGTREMLERIDSFSASLLQQPEVMAVTRDKSAIDTSSTALLEQSFGKGQSDALVEFTLLITM